MMATLRATYIGEAVAASGFALVGVEPRVTPAEADAVWQLVCEARRNSDLVILNQAHADLDSAPGQGFLVHGVSLVYPLDASRRALSSPLLRRAPRVVDGLPWPLYSSPRGPLGNP